MGLMGWKMTGHPCWAHRITQGIGIQYHLQLLSLGMRDRSKRQTQISSTRHFHGRVRRGQIWLLHISTTATILCTNDQNRSQIQLYSHHSLPGTNNQTLTILPPLLASMRVIMFTCLIPHPKPQRAIVSIPASQPSKHSTTQIPLRPPPHSM